MIKELMISAVEGMLFLFAMLIVDSIITVYFGETGVSVDGIFAVAAMVAAVHANARVRKIKREINHESER